MDFTSACGFTMPLGKHEGSTLARIGSNDEGLVGQDWVNGPLREALETYLGHPAISRQLDAVLED
jgi:hypothetical protein